MGYAKIHRRFLWAPLACFSLDWINLNYILIWGFCFSTNMHKMKNAVVAFMIGACLGVFSCGGGSDKTGNTDTVLGMDTTSASGMDTTGTEAKMDSVNGSPTTGGAPNP
jgi:hypothetical protein